MVSSTDLNVLRHAGLGVLGGCCSNVYTLELLINEAGNASTLITFCQFLAVVIFSVALNLRLVRWGRIIYPVIKKPKIPVSSWILPSMLFSTVSLLNNLALEYDIALPLHIVIRSSSLPMSLLMGYLVCSKKVCLARVVSVMLVTVGILLYTYTTLNNEAILSLDSFQEYSLSRKQLTGIFILSLTIVLFTVISLLQERIYTRYGKHWKEGLLYLHLYGILQFILYRTRLLSEYKHISASKYFDVSALCKSYDSPICLSLLNTTRLTYLLRIPRLWVYLLLNSITQVMCVSGVNGLTSLVSPVTLNLILTFRKFTSLLLSVVIFGNTFTIKHFFTASMVVVGTILYTVFRDPPQPEAKVKREDKEQ